MPSTLEKLQTMPDEFQLQYCWARAVEWQTWVMFLSQPILPVCYLFFSWKGVLETFVAFNLIWNIFFAIQAPKLNWAVYGPSWVKLKWLTIPCCAAIFGVRHQWLLLVLTLLTPIVGAILGGIILRRNVGLIQEFFMLLLGHIKNEPREEIVAFLASRGMTPEEFIYGPSRKTTENVE